MVTEAGRICLGAPRDARIRGANIVNFRGGNSRLRSDIVDASLHDSCPHVSYFNGETAVLNPSGLADSADAVVGDGGGAFGSRVWSRASSGARGGICLGAAGRAARPGGGH